MKEVICMSQNDWMDLGKNIGHTLKNAIDTLDFTELNRSIEKTVNSTTSMINNKIKQYSTAVKSATLNQKYDIRKITKIEKKIKSQLSGYRALRAIGGIGTAIFLGFDLIYLLLEGWQTAKPAIAGSSFLLIPCLILLIFGIAGTHTAKKQSSYMKRFHIYISNLSKQDMVPISSLSEAVYGTDASTIADLHDMIADRLFLQGHVDRKKNIFYATDEAFEAGTLPDLPHTAVDDEETPLTPLAQSMIQEGERTLSRIRHYNDLIKDAVVSQKLDTLEQNIRHILVFIQEHPEDAEDARNMTKHYLPSIERLLETYVELSAYPDPGDNIQKSKRDIENTLDTLNFALSELYDDLFEMTSMEVASDISVLETLLAREGLTKDKLPR